MAKNKITLYVDLVSPFGYMAFWLIRNSPTFKSCEVTYVPILLGGVMKATGNTAPINVKNKDKWIKLERMRWADQLNIPMRPEVPPGFPVPTVTAGRVLCAVQQKAPTKLPVALDVLYAAAWAPDSVATPTLPKGSNYDIKNLEVLGGLLGHPEVLGPELAKEVIASVGTPEVKALLGKNTDQALADDAFGLPWVKCTNAEGKTECFWGVDHMGQVVRFLGLGGEEGGDKLRPML